MALTINTNVASLNAQRNLGANQAQLGKAMQRLSSGLRINSAKDDAAGLAIANKMTSQVRGLNQAVRNANDAISMSQTAEGALQESTNILQRMRELAVQSANDTNTTTDRQSIQSEVTQLTSELDRIAKNTKFNGNVLLSGKFSSTAAKFQVGADGGQSIDVKIASATAATLGVSGLSISSQTTANSAIATIDTAIGKVDDIRSGLGAVQNRFESTISNLQSVAENLTAARSRILDADIAAETANLTKYNILQQAGSSILAQANQTPQVALSLLG